MNITDCLENVSYTENGAVGYKTSGNNYVDLTYNLASYRSDPEKFVKTELANFKQNKALASRFLFWVRDIREGMGEKNVFIHSMARILTEIGTDIDYETMRCVLDNIGFYGCYKDAVAIYDILPKSSKARSFLARAMIAQIFIDTMKLKKNENVSLLAKWMPTINSSVVKTKTLARSIIKDSEATLSEKQYRKMISALRKYVDIVEAKMCTKRWNEINYEDVPSKANLIYNRAFMKHDEERRTSYLQDVQDGKTKINMRVTMPYEILQAYNKNSPQKVDDVYETYWKNLKNIGFDSTLVVADTSGSMTCPISESNSCSLYYVAQSLAIYCSEHLSSNYKNKAIVFSNKPVYINFNQCKTLREKIDLYDRYSDYSNTDIEKTMHLILRTATKNHLNQEDLPKNILIISDMEFDEGTSFYYEDNSDFAATTFEKLEKEFILKGYKMPRIIFWNIGSRTGTIPIIKAENGVQLVSGFSTNTLKMFNSGNLDPFEVIYEQISNERYNRVENLF